MAATMVLHQDVHPDGGDARDRRGQGQQGAQAPQSLPGEVGLQKGLDGLPRIAQDLAQLPEQYTRLLEGLLLPPSFRRKLEAYPPSDPYVILSLVTDLDPAAYGFEGTDTFVASSPALSQTQRLNDPEASFFELVFSRYRRPEADPRHHGPQIVAPDSFDYEERWRSGPGLERGEAYRELKSSYAVRLLRNVESRLPGLRQHIVHLDVSTPLTMHRYTLNDRGAPVGWGYKNPLRWKRRAAFLPGLYQAGHWVGPSGVVNAAVSGRQAAELALRDLPRRKTRAG